MKLPFLSIFKKQEVKDYFLAFLLRDEQVHAVVFEEVGGRIQVVGVGKEDLPSSIEELSDNQLLDAADKAISIAEEPLPKGIQTQKTVFGVKPSWVEGSHITKQYLDRLKELSNALELQPIGFLVFPEAIAHLLQKEEGAPVSGILVDGGKKKITITLLRAGRLIQTKEVPLGESLTTTVEYALKTFTDVEILPSRIILFESGDTSIEGKFIRHHWSKTLPFLHVPQIATLSPDFDTRAILFGTATQMGFDAIDLVKAAPLQKSAHVFEDEDQKTNNNTREEEITHVEQSKSSSEGNERHDAEEAQENQPPYSHLPQQDKNPVEELTEAESSAYFGFVKDEDIAQTIPKTHKVPPNNADEYTEEIPEHVKEEETVLPLGFSLSGPAIIEGAKATFIKMSRALPKGLSFPAFRSLPLSSIASGNKVLLLIPAVVFVILVFFVWMIFGIHANVVLTLSPKVITKSQKVTFSTDKSTDVTSDIIGVNSASVDENGKVTVNVTGSKDIGDKAKGNVTIFNSDSSSHTLSSGTVITSSNGLTYTLDQSVTVASGSSDPTNLSAGTASAPITATDIGSDYNLPSGTKFSLANTSSIAAKNDNAFSGGSKKTVTVVSPSDIDTATQQLIKNLTDQAKADLQKQANADSITLPDFTATTLSQKNFDKKAGDQATSLTMSGTVTFQTVVYKKSDIDSYTTSVMQEQIPSHLILAPKGISYDVKDLSVKDGNAMATLDMKASLIPSLNTDDLTKQIAGKSFSQARDILSGVQQFSDATFSLSPNLFFVPKALPHIQNNIRISISTNE